MATLCTTHFGTQRWYLNDLNGYTHRGGDQPAIIFKDGSRWWYCHGKQHREDDKPAVIWTNGTQEWWLDDKRHREHDQPAVLCADGLQQWWTRGTLTRSTYVTNFQESSTRYALVQAVVCVGLGACDVVPGVGSTSTLHTLLAAVQAARTTSYHVTHEYAFLVALLL